MLDRTLLPSHIVVTAEDLRNTPPAALTLLEYLFQELLSLTKQAEALERETAELKARLDQNSTNSSRPPSSDSPPPRGY